MMMDAKDVFCVILTVDVSSENNFSILVLSFSILANNL